MEDLKENKQLMFADYPDIVNINSLTKMLDIGVTLAYRLVRNKTIKAVKVGREYKIPKTNVITYITNMQ